MTAPELYRDPVYDGATDPVVVMTPRGWRMFYTQRRATHPDPGPGVSWVHGSRIGVAESRDGVAWEYAGTLEPDAGGLALRPGPPPADVDVTHWAPEVIHDGTRWRMYLTEIDGVPDRWPGFPRAIVEYVSDDLDRWERRGPVDLSSDRVIDAAVALCPDGFWRLWFKDEAAESVTVAATSPDLERWAVEGVAIGGRPHEGPVAFELGGAWWLVTDEWRGMAVHRSDDAVHWTRQGGPDAVILGAGVGSPAGLGHHGSVVRDGGDLWLYYFGHPVRGRDGAAPEADVDARRCAIHRTRLAVAASGDLVCDAVDAREESRFDDGGKTLSKSLAKRFNA